jgi:hypothetical protein
MKLILKFATILCGVMAGGSLALHEWVQGLLAISLMFAFNAILNYEQHIELLTKHIRDNDR